MSHLEAILRSDLKPKEKQTKLLEAVCSEKITDAEFMEFFVAANDTDKGACADVLEYVCEKRPELLALHIDLLITYINYKSPKVKWGVPKAIGNMAKKYPDEAAKAVPNLLKNAVESKENTTVIRWCAAYGLAEIAKNSKKAQTELIPRMTELAKKETNNGVRNVYLKALKSIEKQLDDMLKNSELTEEDAMTIGKKIKKGMQKRHLEK